MNHAFLPDTVTISNEILDPCSVIVMERQREIDPDHVEILRSSVQTLGVQLVPALVSRRPGGELVLVDGRHRLEAAKEDSLGLRAEVYEGLTREQEQLLELESNRARKNLSAAEALDAWETFDLPMYELRAKEKQAAGGLASLQARGVIDNAPVTDALGNWQQKAPVSIAQAAKEATGHDINWLRNIAAVRDLAHAEDVPEEVRAVAQRGYEKLKTSTAKVGPVVKEVQKVHEAVLRQAEDPQVLLERNAEERLDEMVRHTTLLQERLENSDFRDVLTLAAQKDQMGRESLRAVRMALVNALSTVVVVECTVDGSPSQSLQRIGGEVTHLLSSQSMRQLGLEVRRG
ncbi:MULTISPECIES: ParB N-terminal domain-containing protein [Leucobacter]|uniref:ParB-like nuclease domain-containing protein n=1 Tax=Leucobacter chromiiresistens TaxID=1079994 RepID=A0A1H0YJT8_9MICO|nr:ParB N-terminal domain-containing protein [Leucobacter chromiiresistens]SDQ15452.1 ParB-like nuclease domain-containing protein [Leucobacter chromiiresistens]